MNNRSVPFVMPASAAIAIEQETPANLAMMPRIFRLTSINHVQLSNKLTRCTASLFHNQVSIKVGWTASQPDIRLKSGDLVSPRWSGLTTCEGGIIKSGRLILMERAEPWENLFHTIPHGWVKNRELVVQAATLVDLLPRSYRFLLNAIFWDGQRLKRFCTVPSSNKPEIEVTESVNSPTEIDESCRAISICAIDKFSIRMVSRTWLQSRSGLLAFDAPTSILIELFIMIKLGIYKLIISNS